MPESIPTNKTRDPSISQGTQLTISSQHVAAWTGGHDYSPYTHVDGFAPFTQSPECNLTSLQIYRPTKSLCTNRTSLLNAMSDGGRIGFDAPYQTRDCGT